MSIEARRHSPRIKLSEAAYINFGAGNRAAVLDVSEGGLRFKGSSPLQNSDPVHFWLALEHGAEGVADLAWSNESRTLGGLRFTSVPPEIRTQIRGWLERSALAPNISTEQNIYALEFASPIPPQSAGEAAMSDESELPLATMAALSGEEETEAPLDTRREEVSAPSQAAVGIRHGLIDKGTRLSMFPPEPAPEAAFSYSAPKNSASHRVAAGVLTVLFALVAVVGVLTYVYPGPMLQAMSRFEDKVTTFIGSTHKEPISNVEPASTGSAQLPIESAPPAPDIVADAGTQVPPPFPFASGNGPSNSSKGAPLAQGADQEESAAAKGGSDSPQVRNNSQADLTLAQSYLADGRTPSQQAKAVQLLWLATEKGNVDAEIQLADLYSSGVAVQRSCVQARILLKAAAAASSSVAQQKLSELDRSDCN